MALYKDVSDGSSLDDARLRWRRSIIICRTLEGDSTPKLELPRLVPAIRNAGRDAYLDGLLEFPDGEIVLLTYLMEGQQATVLQLPLAAVGSKAPERAVYV